MIISTENSTINTTYKANRAIKYIVLHYTAGTKSADGAAINTAAWFMSGKAAGSAIITVKTNDGNKTATSTITVTDDSITVIHPEGVTVTPASDTIAVGETKALTATITPEDAADKSITWSSSDTNIATVSDSGEVTAKAVGTATITATTVDGNKTATSAITVVQALTDDVEVTGTIKDKYSVLSADFNLLTASA